MVQFSDITSAYSEYLDALYSYALHLGFDEQTAMDAIHDVFYKLCVRHTSVKQIANLKFYLFRSLKNRLIDIQRTSREYAGILSADSDIYENMPFRLNVSMEDELIREEDRKEIRRKVEKVLNGLTDRQREIIYLRYIHEYDYEEIAQLMHISVESCRNLISRSMNRLKESVLPLTPFLLLINNL